MEGRSESKRGVGEEGGGAPPSQSAEDTEPAVLPCASEEILSPTQKCEKKYKWEGQKWWGFPHTIHVTSLAHFLCYSPFLYPPKKNICRAVPLPSKTGTETNTHTHKTGHSFGNKPCLFKIFKLKLKLTFPQQEPLKMQQTQKLHSKYTFQYMHY